VSRSPIAANASEHSAVSDAVTHGSSATQRMPLPSMAKVSHPSANRVFAASPVRAPLSTG
jgi:hypothetical protein